MKDITTSAAVKTQTLDVRQLTETMDRLNKQNDDRLRDLLEITGLRVIEDPYLPRGGTALLVASDVYARLKGNSKISRE